ncbi:hypothetical protein BGX28_001687 [Mortierella sp. GBA30]|nr:hypothetical protein BGX28_001687 [Mortierella sp. GBA30]
MDTSHSAFNEERGSWLAEVLLWRMNVSVSGRKDGLTSRGGYRGSSIDGESDHSSSSSSSSNDNPSTGSISSGSSTDTRPLIKIPITNGVAQPKDSSNSEAYGKASNADTAAENGPRFEMDHQVPSIQVLEALYPYEGRAVVDDDHNLDKRVFVSQKMEEDGNSDTLDIENNKDKEASSEATAEILLDQYRADANAQLESYKESQQQQPSAQPDVTLKVEEIHDSKTLNGNEHGEVERVSVNKWNKNHEHFDLEDDGLIQGTRPMVVSGDDAGQTGSRGTRTRNRVLAHHHHHYQHINSKDTPSQQQDQGQTSLAQGQDSHIVDDSHLDDIVAMDENPDLLDSANQKALVLAGPAGKQNDRVTSDLEENSPEQEDRKNRASSSQSSPPPSQSAPLIVPDSLRNRGLVPSVLGAHHCTPQFCVNVSVSDDGQFATFHIERDLVNTGWISLGIGYAMTTADLIILWPVPTDSSTHSRGATLSRRTSHSYVEPQLVGMHSTAEEGKAESTEASLYPPDEYILHNRNPLSIDLQGNSLSSSKTPVTLFPQDEDGSKKFIVQFTRPIRTRNRAYKLTPGTEQDFCWAYSPQSISPDSVEDPAAHIRQHLSVGSFAMDVAANQPHLKEVLQKLKSENEKEEAAENEQKKKALEESNRRLAAEERERTKGTNSGGIEKVPLKDGSEEGGPEAQVMSGTATAWPVMRWRSSMTLQACSSLVAVAFMFFLW